MSTTHGTFTVLSFRFSGIHYGLAVDDVARVLADGATGHPFPSLLGLEESLPDEQDSRGVALNGKDGALHSVLLPEPIEMHEVPVSSCVPDSKRAVQPFGLALLRLGEDLILLLDCDLLAERAAALSATTSTPPATGMENTP